MLTLIYGIYTLIICTVMLVVSAVAFVVTVPFDKGRRVVHELSRALVYMFIMVPPTWKRRVEGLDNIEKDKPYVIVINHQSMVDIMMLYLVPMTFRWVSKREVYRIPYIGQFLLLHGDIAIDRSRGADSMRKVTEKGKMWICRGVSIAMFPEGTRSKSGEMGRFKQGAFALAKEAGVEILPVVLHGTRDVLKKNYMVNWRNHLTVSVLPPISAEAVQSMGTTELIEHTRTMMCEEYEKIRK